MAINLATKYEGQLATAYTRASLLTGKTNTDYNWNGVVSINILSPVTQALNDYDRTASGNRYGAPAELQDTKQTLPIELDKSFAIVIDKGNYDEQMFAKKTGEVAKAQIGEQVVPFFDAYTLGKWATNAGATGSITTAVDKDTVLDMFIEAHKHFFNNNINVNGKDQFAYVTATTYSKLLRNPEFISVEKLGADVLSNGVVGKCMGFLVVETPDAYMSGIQALFCDKKAVLAPTKMNELKIHKDAPGISGVLMEGRYRGDAFVLDVKNKGVLKFTV